MKRCTSLLALTLVFVVSANALAWEFNTDGDTEGWAPNPRIDDMTVKDGVMTAMIAANTTDPFITVTAAEPWDAGEITGILARMRWSVDATTAGGKSFFWFNPNPNSVPYSGGDPNEWKVVFVDLMEPTEWTGTINSVGLLSDVDLVFDSSHGLQQTILLDDLPGQNITINLDLSDDT